MVGVRFPRVERVSDLLWPAILGQLVKGQEATRAFRLLTERYGRDAPGPHGLRIPPSARELSELSMDAFLSVGALRDHAERIRFVGKRQTRIDKMAALPAEAFSEALLRYPGIGPWTVASVRARGLGDADAVIVGDYHLPNLISWFFAGEDRGDDARMLELLEPFRGHRARVIRVLELSGLHAPRYGAKRGMRALRR
jgi:3-methyladenine DNA glycosylase/8-oxoguanine DNA glycosylase